MKKILFVLFVLAAFIFVGCESNDNDGASKFDGEWAFVAEYDNQYGWDYYYDESDIYIKVCDNSIAFYETDEWGFSFDNGNYECSRDDFEYVVSATLEIDGDRAYFEVFDEAGYLEVKGEKLYYYPEDEDGYYMLFERIKKFTE